MRATGESESGKRGTESLSYRLSAFSWVVSFSQSHAEVALALTTACSDLQASSDEAHLQACSDEAEGVGHKLSSSAGQHAGEQQVVGRRPV